MLECVIYRIRLVRRIGKLRSSITIYQGMPKGWDRVDVLDWVSHRFGDLIDQGWDARIRRSK